MKYRGIVTDRMGVLPEKKTFWYQCYRDAHVAANALCNMVYSGDRGEIEVITKDAN